MSGAAPLRRIAALLAALVLTAGVGGSLAALAADGLSRVISLRAGWTNTDPAQDGLLVILAIGSDLGPPHRPGDPLRGRADGIHFLVVNPATHSMTVVDVPRDSAIGGGKVNAHLTFGGPDALEAQLEAWSGLPIDYWVVGSFWSLQQVATGLGGLEIEVQQPMQDPFSGTNLQPGLQRLDPGQALAFTRDRKSLPDGDIGRSHNQGRLMISALEQMRREAPSLQQVMGLVSLLEQSTVSNIPPGEVLPLALTALRISPERIAHETISGPFGTINGGSVIYAQPGDLFARLASGQVGPP